MTTTIHRIHAFSDNYIWLIEDKRQALVVDPGDAAPVMAFLQERELTLAGILVTHHHPDHIGGIPALIEQYDCSVYGPKSVQIPMVTHAVQDSHSFVALGLSFTTIATPGHTLTHVVYFASDIDGAGPALFSGDTLFAAGCGRLFEGTPQQMQESMAKISALPPETRVFCAHEYTLSNLRFAHAVEPGNSDIEQRLHAVEQQRLRNEATIPSTLAVEFCTNPFLRYDRSDVTEVAAQRLGRQPLSHAETFAAIRLWKDNF